MELLDDKDSSLILVDYLPAMFKGVGSGDKTIIKSAAICAAKAARILSVPVVLSSIHPQAMGGSFRKLPVCFLIKSLLQERYDRLLNGGKN